MNIEKDGIIYFFEKNKGEVNNIYYERVNKIAEQKPKNKNDLDKIKRDISFNISKKHLGCGY